MFFSLLDVRAQRLNVVFPKDGPRCHGTALQSAQERAELYSMMAEDLRQHAVTEEILREFLLQVGVEQNQMQTADVESRAFAFVADICLHWFFDFGLILGR